MSEDQTLNLSDFAKVIDFNSLYQSYTEARKGKRWKYAVCKYEVNVLENLMFVHFEVLPTERGGRLGPEMRYSKVFLQYQS